jgi:N-hydroxyarylamine O-acetyltransferase
VERRARELSDFAPACWWHATSPDSHFTQGLISSLPTPDGRMTLSGDKLTETVDGKRVQRVLAAEEIPQTLRTHFGISLDEAPSPGSFPATGPHPFPN